MRIPINTKEDENIIYAPFEEAEQSDDAVAEAAEPEGDSAEHAEGTDPTEPVLDPSIFDADYEAEEESDAENEPEPEYEDEEDAPEDESFVSAEEYDALQARYDRLMADWENYRRRSAEEQAVAKEQANRNLVEAIIPTLDNFTMALQHAETSTTDDGMVQGFAAIHRSLIGSLGKEGLVIIHPEIGDAFDMNEHQAIERKTDTDLPTESIAGVVQDGYKFNGYILRPALVSVAV